MRNVATALLLLGCVILPGCDVNDMVDSKVLSTVQEYFPLAEIGKPQPDVLAINIHVGNVTEKFGAKVFQTMLADNAAELQLGFGLARYTRLLVAFDDFSCLWDIRRNAQFGSSDRPARQGVPGRMYQVYENRRIAPSAPLPRCPVCPVCGRGGDEPLACSER
jgi:hypothetical protein